MYTIGAFGYSFNGWPDGGPLLEQEHCAVDCLRVVLSEMLEAMKDG